MPAKKAPSGQHNGATKAFWSDHSVGPERKTAADNTAARGVGPNAQGELDSASSDVRKASEMVIKNAQSRHPLASIGQTIAEDNVVGAVNRVKSAAGPAKTQRDFGKKAGHLSDATDK